MFPKIQNIRCATRGKTGGIVTPLLLFVAVAVVLAIFYFASLSKGSREEFDDAQSIRPDPVAAEKKLAESQSAESEFNSIHEFKKDQIAGSDIDLYEKAVDAYRDYLAYAGMTAYNPRFEQMRRRLHDLRADSIRKQTSLLETRAEDFASQKNYAEAEKLFREAGNLENRITREFPLATKKNHARARFLDSRARTMQAIPMQIRARELEDEGEKAIAAKNWAKAKICFAEAREIEKTLWADYRNVIASSSSQIAKLNTLLETVDSSAEYETRERCIAAAQNAEKIADWKTAAAEWEKAIAAQDAIEKNFPGSLYAGKEITEKLKTSFANAAAFPSFEQLRKLREEIDASVRSRDVERVPLLAKQALRMAESIVRERKENTLVSEDLLKELRYLDLKAPDIATVQHSFFNLLLPIPGQPENVKMTKTEISQALYTFVMPFNPSVRREHALPVESVDFLEATEFCRRLSLLVGYPVRLPTQKEFAAAAGTPDTETLLRSAWLIENSSGLIHAVGKREAGFAGFFDLYGNVSEWVLPDDPEDSNLKKHQTFSAGGDAQTPVYAFPNATFAVTNRTEKSRIRGFRVVIEFDRGNAPADASRSEK